MKGHTFSFVEGGGTTKIMSSDGNATFYARGNCGLFCLKQKNTAVVRTAVLL